MDWCADNGYATNWSLQLTINIMSITDILATYATEELEELLQFVETKEGRFQKLKRELKEELAVRADVELWSQPAC